VCHGHLKVLPIIVMEFKTLEISVFTGGAGMVDLEEAEGQELCTNNRSLDRICSATSLTCLLRKPRLSHAESFRHAGKTRSFMQVGMNATFIGLVEAEYSISSFSSHVATS